MGLSKNEELKKEKIDIVINVESGHCYPSFKVFGPSPLIDRNSFQKLKRFSLRAACSHIRTSDLLMNGLESKTSLEA